MQYSFKPSVGRMGMILEILALTEGGEVDHTYQLLINSKGFEAKRWDESDPSVTTLLCDFDSFMYPDRIEEEEVDMCRMIMGSSRKLDREVMFLCSTLCARYSAGHEEDSLTDVIRSTLQYWMDNHM